MTRHIRSVIRSDGSAQPAPVHSGTKKLFHKGTAAMVRPSSNPEETSGSDFTIGEPLVKSGGPLEINRQVLHQTLRQLHRVHDVKIQELSLEQTELFRSVVETLRLLYNSPALYELILKDVNEVFQDVTVVKPGTVGAFFRGCFTSDSFEGPLGCSPKCADSLPPSEGTPGYTKCDDLVLIYTNQDFNSLNNKISPHAYVYLEHDNFTGFTKHNLTKLRDAGIDQVTLVMGSENGAYQGLKGPYAVETMQPSDANTADATPAAIALVALIVIILLLFCLIVYRDSE